MLDEFIVEKLEAKLVTGLDGIGGRNGLGTLVATQVVRVHQLTGEGWVVAIAVLARIGILSTNRGAIDDQPVEDVVRIGEGRGERKEGDGLHNEDV